MKMILRVHWARKNGLAADHQNIFLWIMKPLKNHQFSLGIFPPSSASALMHWNWPSTTFPSDTPASATPVPSLTSWRLCGTPQVTCGGNLQQVPYLDPQVSPLPAKEETNNAFFPKLF